MPSARGGTCLVPGLDLDLEPAVVDGDRALLERLVANLVDNAVLHNLDRGWISLETRTDGNRVRLRVASSGGHVDSERVDELFERFHRLDDARDRAVTGFGLGLSIVAAVVAAHEGRRVGGAAPRRRPRGECRSARRNAATHARTGQPDTSTSDQSTRHAASRWHKSLTCIAHSRWWADNPIPERGSDLAIQPAGSRGRALPGRSPRSMLRTRPVMSVNVTGCAQTR